MKPSIISENNYKAIPLRMENMCEAEGYLWFTSYHYNALFRMDKMTLLAEYVCSFPNETSVERMYSQLLFCDGKIYCIPLSANSIGVYNISDGSCRSVQINPPSYIGSVKYQENNKFFDAFFDDEYIYLFPNTYPAIVRLCISDDTLEYYYDVINANACNKPAFYFGKGIKTAESFWVFNNSNHCLCKFIRDESILIEKYKFDFSGIAVIAGNEDYIWVYSYNDNGIYKYEPKNNKCLFIKNTCKEFIPGTCPVSRSAIFNDKVYFLPGTGNLPLELSMDNNSITVCNDFAPKIFGLPDREIWKYSFVEVLDDCLYTYDITSSKLIILDNNGMEKRLYVNPDYTDTKATELSSNYWICQKKDNRKVSDLKSFLLFIDNQMD